MIHIVSCCRILWSTSHPTRGPLFVFFTYPSFLLLSLSSIAPPPPALHFVQSSISPLSLYTHTHTHGIIIILYWLKNNFVNNIAPKYLVVNTLYKTLRFSPPFEKIWNKLNIWNGFLIFVFTFFHLFKEGAYLRDDPKIQTPVSHAWTDLLLPLAEWFLHSWVTHIYIYIYIYVYIYLYLFIYIYIYIWILWSTGHVLLSANYILCTLSYVTRIFNVRCLKSSRLQSDVTL